MLIGDILELAVLKDPMRPALLFEDRTIRFGELHQRSLRLSIGLRDFTSPGDRVAILAENIPEYVEAYYGVPGARLILVLLNYRLSPPELAWILTDSQATVLLVQDKYLEALRPFLPQLQTLKTVVVIGATTSSENILAYEEVLRAVDTAADQGSEKPSPGDIAWLVYTSGTTGYPKGAMVTDANIVANSFSTALAFEARPTDRNLFCFPLCHISGLNVFMHHLLGACVAVTPAFEATKFLELVETLRITSTSLAPTMVHMILEHPDLARYDLSSLRQIVSGGSGWNVDLLRSALQRFGAIITSAYGMTETGTTLFIAPDLYRRAAEGATSLLNAAGLSMPLACVRVVDDDGIQTAPGVVGEIIVRSEQTTRGYWRNPEATRGAYTGDWFHTGDLATLDEEGFLYIVDRKQDMILTGGENVYSLEVERILQSHESVSEVAVIGLPDARWGESVTAVIVAEPTAPVSAENIIAFCKKHLASYKSPRRVIFIDDLPRNNAGKVLKRELRRTFSHDAPERVGADNAVVRPSGVKE